MYGDKLIKGKEALTLFFLHTLEVSLNSSKTTKCLEFKGVENDHIEK